MRLARAHVLIGVDDEARLAGVEDVIHRMRAALEEADLSEEVQLVETGTLGVSGHGVVLVIYPEGIYYGDVTPELVPTIVEEHLLKGRPVDSLRLPSAAPAVRPAQVYERQRRVVLRNCGLIDPGNIDEYVAAGGYEALGKALTEMSPGQVVSEVKPAGDFWLAEDYHQQVGIARGAPSSLSRILAHFCSVSATGSSRRSHLILPSPHVSSQCSTSPRAAGVGGRRALPRARPLRSVAMGDCNPDCNKHEGLQAFS